MDKEKKIYTEVYMTLTKLNQEMIDRIPNELKQEIVSKADTSYPYKVDELEPESQAIIASIMEKYLRD